ncbi:hypothetical protein GWI33_017775 [Rhynchophorus ferrugineus]|uniref:Uncharacterized protein n=1 Tax=Rhynchophorus ferrugineus TaxID=354439 RepID=A0A834M7A9_RHYFE|nr:hypothetical protein GWI33_017775 [Rhynchophorus ferrugineus]
MTELYHTTDCFRLQVKGGNLENGEVVDRSEGRKTFAKRPSGDCVQESRDYGGRARLLSAYSKNLKANVQGDPFYIYRQFSVCSLP